MRWVQKILDILFTVRTDEKRVRALSTEDVRLLYNPHIVYATRPYAVALLEMHESAVRSLIHEVKYHENARALSLLGSVLSRFLETVTGEIYIIPIPLSAKRKHDRGFNQAERIAEQACIRYPDKPWHIEMSLVSRVRHTVSQVSLPRHERIENVRGAFACTRTPDANITYVVLDDVMTTGATMQEVIDVLNTNGATHMIPVVLAH